MVLRIIEKPDCNHRMAWLNKIKVNRVETRIINGKPVLYYEVNKGDIGKGVTREDIRMNQWDVVA